LNGLFQYFTNKNKVQEWLKFGMKKDEIS